MSNLIPLTYPHGFKSISKVDADAKKTEFTYDVDVANFYRSYINNEVDFNNWDYRTVVFEEAFRLFTGNFEEWVIYQINVNTNVYAHSLDFLLDTLNFITGKGRKISPFVWKELMLTDPDSKSSIEISNRKIRRLKDLYPKLPANTAEVIQLWCSQENGFEDMLVSLFIFFGPSNKVNNSAIQSIKVY